MANKNEFQSRLVQGELIRKWRKITSEPAVTKFSRAPLPESTRERLFLEKDLDGELLNKVSLVDVDIEDNILPDSLLREIPGMRELAFLQGTLFPQINQHYVELFRSTRFPTPERIRQIKSNGIVDNAGQDRLNELYNNPQYKEERQRVLSPGPLATAILPQERIVPGLPVFPSVLDALGVHGEFRHQDLDQVIISVFAIPLSVLEKEIQLFYNPPVVVNHVDETHDLELKKFRPYWNVRNNGKLSYRVFPDSAYYRRVFGLQIYEAYLKGKFLNNETFDRLGIQVRHFLTDLYGIDMEIEPRTDTIRINGKSIPGATVYKNIDFLFGLTGGMDALGLERNKASHLPFKLQEIL
ncbi:MAG: hypothetical protein WC741_03695 [Patescibacteria group bacterium]|jgi:hypothetical protein